MKRLSVAELIPVILWSALIMAVTAVPYHIAAREAGPDRQFAGFISGVDDGNVYLSWVRQAAEGHLLLRNPYTTREQSPHFFSIFLLALGWIVNTTGLSPQQVFMGARYVCGVFCLVAFYGFMAQVTLRRPVRWAALVLVSISSGLGWLVVLFGEEGGRLGELLLTPMDVSNGWQAQPEAILFLSLLLNPLFAFSFGLMALTAGQVVRMHEGRSLGPAIATGLLLLILGNVHGYDIFVLHGMILVWICAGWLSGRTSLGRAASQYVVVLVLSAASPIWAWYAGQADPAYQAKMDTPTLSPSPFDVALGFGIVLLLATVGAWIVAGEGSRLARRRNAALLGIAIALGLVACSGVLPQVSIPGLRYLVFALPLIALFAVGARRDATDEQRRAMLLIVWAACGAAVLYLPVSFQRKMIEGLHLALCGLGGFAIAGFIGAAQERSVGVSAPVRVMVAAGLILATVPSNVLYVGECMRLVRSNNRVHFHLYAPPMYLSTAELEGMDWLEEHTTEDDIVLSSSFTGNHIPAHAPCTVVVGHWAETLDFGTYLGWAKAFYEDAAAPETRKTILDRTRANYVWWGPQERALQEALGGPASDPCETLPDLQMAYENSQVRIYTLRTDNERTDG